MLWSTTSVSRTCVFCCVERGRAILRFSASSGERLIWADIVRSRWRKSAELFHNSAMSGESDLTHLRLRIEGSVQAVGYGNYVITEATRLEVDGWIRNRSDGTVEALVSGPNAAVVALVGLCMRGPPGARVGNVEMHKSEPPAERGFHGRPTL